MKKFIRKILNKLGFDVHRLSVVADPNLQLLASMHQKEIDIVFDIGANTGQFATEIRSKGFQGEIISFEPLTSARRSLLNKAERDSKWLVHEQAAIGDQNGEIEINISGNSVSSSVFPMLEAHSSAAIDSIYVGKEVVPIVRLDSISHQYLHSESKLFIKIDAQGFEWQVLNGAVETLKRVQGVLCELSLVPLYEGQHLWLEVIDRLEASGFTLWAIQKGFTDPRNGRSLQVDAIFLKVG